MDNKEEIKGYDKYKYLGVIFNRQGTDNENIREKIIKVKCPTVFKYFIMKHIDRQKDKILRIYDSIIKSDLMYSKSGLMFRNVETDGDK